MAENPGTAEKRPRLLEGEFRAAGDRRQEQQQCLDAVERTAPEVLESLYDDVLPEWKNEEKKSGSMELTIRDWAAEHGLVEKERWDWDNVMARCNYSGEAVSAAIRGSAEWTFYHGFLRPVVGATLDEWTQSSGRPAALRWAKVPENTTSDEISSEELANIARETGCPCPVAIGDQPVYTFQCSRWKVTKETRGEAQQCIMEELLAVVKAKLEEVAKLADKSGMRRVKEISAREHFDWLVRYQVQGWSHNQIAKYYRKTRATIANGIENAAELVIGTGWKQWLRPPKRAGRPRTAGQ